MLAGHYPMVFATKFSWLILAIVIVIGALIRHFLIQGMPRKKRRGGLGFYQQY